MKNGLFGQRRDFFIKKWLQFKFTLIFLFIIVVGNILFGAYIYEKLNETLMYYMYVSHTTDVSNTWEIIGTLMIEPTLWTAVIFLTLFLIIIYIVTKKLSQGLDIVSKDLIEMKNGNLATEPEIPDSSSIKKLKKLYYEFKQGLNENVSNTKENAAEFNTSLDKVIASTDNKDKADVIKTLEDLEQSHSKLQSSINKIQL